MEISKTLGQARLSWDLADAEGPAARGLPDPSLLRDMDDTHLEAAQIRVSCLTPLHAYVSGLTKILEAHHQRLLFLRRRCTLDLRAAFLCFVEL